MLRVREIDHVVLRIVDVGPMLSFYRDVLGCTVERQDDAIGLIQLRAGRSLIDLVPVTGKLGRAGGRAPGAEGRNLDHLCLRIEPYDEPALCAMLKAHGVEIGEAGSRFGAEGEGPSIYIRDPEGNTVELKGPPAARPIPSAASAASAAPTGPSRARDEEEKARRGVPVPVVRRLETRDAAVYREVRLAMLREHPESYGSSLEDEAALPLAQFEARLGHEPQPAERLVFGAFVAGDLIASAAIVFDQRRKERHRAHLVAVYVAPLYRGTGVAQRIVQSCLESARSRTGIDIVLLRLTAGNHAARALYASLGFRSYGVEPDSMRIDGVSFSTELMALPLGSRAEQPEGRRS